MADHPQNPFLHSHDHHGHHHHDDAPTIDESVDLMDPAQQSLSDALRVSFAILKVIMALLVGVYCFTGIFSVDASEVAVRLRFGRIIGQGVEGDQVYGPGWHFGWPYPIEQKIYVPTASLRTVSIDRTFWFQVTPQQTAMTLDQLAERPQRSLNPERDGSLITGDANIIHAQFDVKYRITDPVNYVTYVGDMETADRLVRAAAEEGIVFAAARIEADAALKKQSLDRIARDKAQAVLDAQQTGIAIPVDAGGAGGIIINNPTMPLSVREAYYAGINAESQRAQRVSDARTEATTTLNATAGSAHDELFALIQNYEYQHTQGNTEAADAVSRILDQAFTNLRVEGVPISGDVARLISEAKTYKTQVVEQVKSEAATFTAYLDDYRANPDLQRNRLWQDAREQIFTGDVETFYADGKLYIVTNRDPDVQRAREEQRILETQQDQPRPRDQ